MKMHNQLTWDKNRAPVDELAISGMTHQLIQDGKAWDPVGRLEKQDHRKQTSSTIYQWLVTQQ